MRVLISENEIQKRIQELGRELSEKLPADILLVGILKGSFLFFADLVRTISGNPEIQFIQASSYGSATVSSGNVDLQISNKISFSGKHILIIEDIIDTGLTLDKILADIQKTSPASISICSLLIKKGDHKEKYPSLFYGFEIEDLFVVGYGLDYNEKYRTLRDIFILEST